MYVYIVKLENQDKLGVVVHVCIYSKLENQDKLGVVVHVCIYSKT